ncbi:MAG: complex I NDUFA9 subunit family protein [Alphaproteobacteria bacterium]|nr:MAG: complex I NDUFA9 subunit family protein [Alphaproteobacteria bacterium]
MANDLVTIFGAAGQLGRAFVERLAGKGYRIRAASRHPDEALFLKPLGDVGQVQTTYADLSKPDTVTRAVAGANIVINCVGILSEGRGGQKFSSLQAEGPGIIGRAAKAAGVKTLIHISAIGAAENSPAKYARSKWAGEVAVQKAFPGAIIFRPSIIFGPDDSFFNAFAKMAKNPFAPLPIVGPKVKFQPVYVEDIAAAVALAVTTPQKLAGKIFELGGPRVYTFRELLDYMLDVIKVKKLILPLPFFIAGIIGGVFQTLARILPLTPPLTADQVKLLKRDNVVGAKAKTFADLGITPTPLEAVVPGYLAYFRTKGQFS